MNIKKKIKSDIIKAIKTLPGLVNLASMNFKKQNSVLTIEKLEEGILIEELDNKNDLSIGVVLKEDSNAKVVIGEVHNTIVNIFKKNKTPLSNVRIYVRGVK